MIRRTVVPILLVTLLRPDTAPGQGVASTRYLSSSSWTRPFLDHLDRAGVLPGLDPLTRPLTRAAVSAALGAPRTGEVHPAAWAAVARLHGEFVAAARAEGSAERMVRAASWGLDGRVGVLGASDASRWELRPQPENARLFPQASLEAVLELPHLVLVTAPAIDNRLKYDSLYGGKQDRVIAGRAEAAYVLASWRWLDAFFGRMERNWGPPEAEGLLVSPVPYSAEHLFVRLGPERLRLELIAAQLDPVVPWDSVRPVDRWQVSHRLVARPSARLAISLGESIIYGGSGLPWRFLNPVNLGLLSIYDGAPEANSLLSADVSWRAAPSARLYAQVLVDDIQVDRKGQGDREPAAYGLTFGGSGGLMRGRLAWAATYTRVSNLAYRTPLNEHQYTQDGLGLARNWSDYDEAALRLTMLARADLLVGAGLHVQRQGEGDMRLRYPPVSAFADSLGFLTGVVERSVQPGVEAAWAPSPWVSVTGSLALRTTRNTGHVSGASEERWLWRLGISLRRRMGGTVGR